MSTTPTPTPNTSLEKATPFNLPLQNGDYGDDIIDAAGKLTIQLYGDERVPDTLEQREYLTRAVNSFDDMLAALKAAHELLTKEHFDSSDALVERCAEIGAVCDAAIAKAEKTA